MHLLRRASLLLAARAVPPAGTAAHAAADEPAIALNQQNARLTGSAHVQQGVYHLPDDDNRDAVHIAADDLIIDFCGAQLIGSSPGQAPDTYRGTNIVVHGRNITLRNAAVLHLRIEHFEIDGYVQLQFRLQPGRQGR